MLSFDKTKLTMRTAEKGRGGARPIQSCVMSLSVRRRSSDQGRSKDFGRMVSPIILNEDHYLTLVNLY
jgi:hypothetical protein